MHVTLSRPTAIQLKKSTYCKGVDAIASGVLGTVVVTAVSTCANTGLAAGAMCAILTGPSAAATGGLAFPVVGGGCTALGSFVATGCFASVTTVGGFNALQLTKLLGCGGTENMEAGESCSRVHNNDGDCRTGVCSNTHVFGDQFCCPGERPNERGAVEYSKGFRFCKYQCVNLHGEKAICIPNEDFSEWLNLELNDRKAKGDWCYADYQCMSNSCSFIHGCKDPE